LDLEEVVAGMGTELFRLILQKVAQHPGNGFSSCPLAGALFSSSQIAGGGEILWFPSGELIGDRSGGSA